MNEDVKINNKLFSTTESIQGIGDTDVDGIAGITGI